MLLCAHDTAKRKPHRFICGLFLVSYLRAAIACLNFIKSHSFVGFVEGRHRDRLNPHFVKPLRNRRLFEGVSS